MTLHSRRQVERIEVIAGVQCRRRYSAQEKAFMVAKRTLRPNPVGLDWEVGCVMRIGESPPKIQRWIVRVLTYLLLLSVVFHEIS